MNDELQDWREWRKSLPPAEGLVWEKGTMPEHCLTDEEIKWLFNNGKGREAKESGDVPHRWSLRMKCEWTFYGDSDAWDTGCGRAFVLNDGAPLESDMRYCCFCGRLLKEVETLDEPQ